MVTIAGTTQLLGVIGDPVEHSLSPAMHNAAIAHLGLDFVYLPFPVRSPDLKQALDGFAAIGLQGFNITIPHKQSILPLLQQIDPLAAAVGAVNTVWRVPEGWQGTNTDVAGFIAPLRETYGRDWQQTTVAILGCGGAARAVVAGCDRLGCPRIWVFGRDHEKLQRFLESWRDAPLQARLEGFPWSQAAERLAQVDLLVNSTPVGMHPHVDRAPLDAAAIERLSPDAIAYDLIYTPSPTRFLQLARERGAVAIDGLEMLVRQGAAAFEIWTGQMAPLDVMRRSLQEKLGLR